MRDIRHNVSMKGGNHRSYARMHLNEMNNIFDTGVKYEDVNTILIMCVHRWTQRM